MASLFLRGNYWHIRFYDRVLGYTCSIATGCPNTREGKVQANKKLRDVETKLYLNRFDPLVGGFKKKLDHKPIRISEGFELFKAERVNNDKDTAEKTLESYRLSVDRLKDAIGDCFIHTITKDVNQSLKELFDKRKLSVTSRAIYTRTLRSLFNFFVEEGYLKENPIRAISPEKKEPEPVPLEDVRKMLDYLKKRQDEYKKSDRSQSYKQAYDLIKLLALSGLRISEADALKWEDINLIEDLMTVHNIKEKRKDEYFPISKELHEHLISMQPKDKGKLFSRFTDKRSVRRIWDTMNEKLGFSYTMHQLRKTTSSVLTEAHVDHVATQKYIRHKNFQTTLNSYAKMRAKSIKKEIDSKTKFKL